MRKLYLFLLISLLIPNACSQGPIKEAYTLKIPSLPALWSEFLGNAHWRLEWIENGSWVSWEGKEGLPELSFTQEWTSPVLAWPFWPEKGIIPGLMYPAGALFPWDISQGSLNLSWKAGVDAFFWKELAKNEDKQTGSGTPRLPWLFDWPRFRELMESENVPVEIRQNPWLADWNSIAERTVESGFDRRRIRAEVKVEISIPSPSNLWVPSSPFGEPINTIPGEALVLLVKDDPETWISKSGLIRSHKEAWIFIPF